MNPIPASNMHLSSSITSVEFDPLNPSTARITFNSPDGDSVISGFDHVILATQAKNAVPILSTLRSSYSSKSLLQRATDAQIACLRRFPYVKTIVVNHRDESFLPANKSDVRDLNLVCVPGARNLFGDPGSYKSDIPCLPAGYAMATHVIPQKTQSSILQTTNPIHPPHPDSIISIARIERALVSIDSKEAQKGLITVGIGRWKLMWNGVRRANSSWLPFRLEFARPRQLGKLQAPGRLTPLVANDSDTLPPPPGVWLCGSYAHPGIPLLESCVTSALAVVEDGIFEIEGVKTRASWAIRV